MSAINITMAAFILKLKGYFLQAVIITNSLCREDDASIFQMELTIITQKRVRDCTCHRRGEFLITRVCCHGDTIGYIAGFNIEDVLSRCFIAQGIVELSEIVVAHSNCLSRAYLKSQVLPLF